MTPDGIISAIVIGALLGVLARFLVSGRQRISVLVTILVGVLAAFVGTWVAWLVGVETTDGIDWIELLFQLGFAVLGVLAVSVPRRQRR